MTKRAGVASPKALTNAPKAVTGNRLSDGAVVFRAPDGAWVRAVSGAAIAEGAEAAEALLEEAKQDAARAMVVEPYLIDMTVSEGALRPLALREQIRAEGPSFAIAYDKPWAER